MRNKKILASTVFLMGLGLTGGIPLAYAGNMGVQVVQQNTTCKGTVTSADGEPIIGASVVVKGTQNGTITDLDGNFSLANVSKGATIEVSFIGYKATSVVFNGQPLTIKMSEDTQMLDDVVIVGYGTQKKTNLTGAVSMVGSETLKDRPVANVTQALQGAVPGLNISTTNTGGELGGGMSLNIRGTGSIGNGSTDQPLVLIDGIEGNINLISPNDIESISVLKDAASASIYGSRAAFGVILITTKSGKAGKVRVSYSGDVRFSSATQVPDMLDSYSFAKYWNEAAKNGGQTAPFSDEMLQNIQDFQAGKFTDPNTPEYYGFVVNPADNKYRLYKNSFGNTNWFDEFYKKNVPSTQHNLSLSGGNEKMNWMLSSSYLNQNGLIRYGHDKVNRYNLNAKFGAKLTDWASFDYSLRFIQREYVRPTYLDGNGGLFFHNIARRWPTVSAFDPHGYPTEGMEIAELRDGGVADSSTKEFVQQLNFLFTPVKDWNIHVDGAYKTSFDKERHTLLPVYHYLADGKTAFLRDSGYGTLTRYSDNRTEYIYYAANIYTDYSKTFGKNNFKALAGLNYEKFENANVWGSGKNLVANEKPFLSNTQTDQKTGDNYWHRATAGYFGRLNYDFDGKYLLEANLRYDGSSRFLADKRWALFPSFSAGWNISREAFWKPLENVVNSLKLRASWGQLGNTSAKYEHFSDWYPFYQQQSFGAASGSWLINGEKPNIAAMPGIISSVLTWETVESFDFGLDFGLFNNRLTGSFDVYQRNTRNMVGPAPTLASILGADAPKINNCDMKSYGWELEVGWKDRIGDFNYSAKLNLSDGQSEITNYPNDNFILSDYYSGMKLNQIWGYQVEGLAKTDEEMVAWVAKNTPNWGKDWGAGDVMYKDLDGDGKVSNGNNKLFKIDENGNKVSDHGDLVVIGNSTPRYRIGVNLSADWKGFDISAFFQGVLKRDWAPGQSNPYFWGAEDGIWQSTGFKEHLNHWTPENTDAYYPKPAFGNGNKNFVNSDRYLQSAAYVRCKNIQLGYSLPESLLKNMGVGSCRIYISCDNLVTFTGLSKIFDPEALDGRWSLGSGKTYPLQRTVAVGLNLNF